MAKRGMFGKMFFLLLVIVVILHTAIHFFSFEGEIVGLTKGSISGFSVGKVAIGEEILETYPVGPSLSRLIVIGEWFFVLIFAIFLYIGSRMNFIKEIRELRVLKNSMESEHSTDLDSLYGLLKSRKRVSFKAIAKVFDIKLQLAEEWGETLESGGLATVEYPRMGGAELVLKGGN